MMMGMQLGLWMLRERECSVCRCKGFARGRYFMHFNLSIYQYPYYYNLSQLLLFQAEMFKYSLQQSSLILFHSLNIMKLNYLKQIIHFFIYNLFRADLRGYNSQKKVISQIKYQHNQNFDIQMNPWRLIKKVIQMAKHSFKSNSSTQSKFEKVQVLNQLTSSQTFQEYVQKDQIQQWSQRSSNLQTLKKLNIKYYGLFAMVVMLSCFGVVGIIMQPYVNDYVKKLVKNKFEQTALNSLWNIIWVYLLYKIATSFIYIASDFNSMVLGVKFHSTITHKLLHSQTSASQITCLQDDSQRLQNLPSSSTTSVTKICQFITLSTILISRLPSSHQTVAISYWLFFIIVILLAFVSAKLNFKIMKFKQQRININAGQQQIKDKRNKEIFVIKQLMIVDGIGLILPWLLNVLLMVVIYGIVGMKTQEKYFVLTIFGLLRVSISGLGTNLNYFAQAWSSLQRITSQLSSINSHPISDKIIEDKLLIQSQSQINLNSLHQSLPNSHQSMHSQQNKLEPTISTLIKLCRPKSPFVVPIMAFLIGLNFTSNFMYSYFAKSLIAGQSIFSPFNIATLTLQLLSPILLFAYLSNTNQKLSKSVYERLLSKGIQNLKYIGSEGINRLAGDIRLLDRQLYFAAYGSISHLNSIGASLLYSIVILNNTFSSVLLTLTICFALWVSWLSYRFIFLRKQCYRLQATAKGQLLKSLFSSIPQFSKWRSIYTYKIFGFSIQVTFISILYILILVISIAIIVIVMLSESTVEQSSILIMLISQLDYQFLILFVQVVMMQTALTAVSRCFAVIQQVEKAPSTDHTNQENTVIRQ